MKQFILFIVEGPHDKDEINAILLTKYFCQYLSKYSPQFLIFGGDVFADSRTKETNIKKRIEDLVNNWRNNGMLYQRVKTSDVHEIVHIIDTDGAFIPDDSIEYDECAAKVRYYEDKIYSSTPTDIVGIHRKKTNTVNAMRTVDKIANIPYSMYYLSMNMDHVLFGRINPTKDDKHFDAKRFQLKCKENDEYLDDSLFKKEISSQDSYAGMVLALNS